MQPLDWCPAMPSRSKMARNCAIHASADAINDNGRLNFADEIQVRVGRHAVSQITDVKLNAIVQFVKGVQINVCIVHRAETELGSL